MAVDTVFAKGLPIERFLRGTGSENGLPKEDLFALGLFFASTSGVVETATGDRKGVPLDRV
jgi:hypothetical protein